MLYFIFLTHRCNLNCSYCGETSYPILSVSKEISYSDEELFSFLARDPNPIIAFYGGEPSLNLQMMYNIINKVDRAKFVLQTNGTLLSNILPDYLEKIDTILVSIDGSERITDFYRGKGTYKKIMSNTRYIRQNGFSGDLIARMTVSYKTNIYDEVNHLLSLENPKFDHIHWQLDVIWSDKEKWHSFERWVNTRYNPGITRLIKEWLENIKDYSRVVGIVPFIGIMRTLLEDSPTKLRCGAGIDAFAVQTNGDIYACPVCPEFEDFKVGELKTATPARLNNSLSITSPCLECEYLSVCGGRCLFTNRHNFWGNDFELVCMTVKHLIDELRKIKPVIKNLIEAGKLNEKDFSYPSYNNTCEIIP
ncbi:MAG: TIGR04084 family radical SAM/SPASM domain-containing protein [Candidatus Hodarchaeales archaeon]